MSTTIEEKEIWDYIGALKQRIDRLETGGKPMIGRSGIGGALIELDPSEEIGSIAATLSWNETDVVVTPNGIPYFAIFVDNDNDPAYLWPSGVSLSSGQKNLEFDWFLDADDFDSNGNRTRVRVRMKNNDGSAHDYYFYVIWTYMKGGSGSS